MNSSSTRFNSGLISFFASPVILVASILFCFSEQVPACQSCSKHAHTANDYWHYPNEPVAPDPDTASAANSSVQASSTPGSFTFALVADTQGNPGTAGILSQLSADINSRMPDFTVFPGDLVGTGTVATYAEWNTATGVLGNDRYMVPGNHDLPGRPATNSDWQTAFNWLPDSQTVPNVTTSDPNDTITGVDKMDYYFDMGNSRFISVTSDRDALPGESGDVFGGVPRAIDWFQSVMSMPSTQAMDHIFVFTHHSVTTQPSDALGGVNGDWWKTVSGQNPDLNIPAATALMSGHWHMYQPSRPDPLSDTLEFIHGTGGGSLEGAPQHAIHGFSLITVDGLNVTSQFYGDADGASGGWQFDDLLDEFVITSATGAPKGELAFYEFLPRAGNLDSSTSPASKQHQLNFTGATTTEDHPERQDVLRLTGGFADAKATGESNLGVVGDLTISLHAKPISLGSGIDNMLVAFGDADDSLDFATTQMEAANYAYQLSYMDDGRLRLAWEYDVQILEEVFSSVPVANPTDWHQIEVQRDADNQTVAFYVDGQLLGAPVPFDNNATGAGAGSFYLGALPDGASNFFGWIDDVSISNSSVDVLFGDLDQDGDIDLADWHVFQNAFQIPLTGTSADYLLGDLDLSGTRGLTDANEFRKAFERANGISVQQAIALAAIPEPSSALTSLFGLLLIVFFYRQRSQFLLVSCFLICICASGKSFATQTLFYEDFETVLLEPNFHETLPNQQAWTDTPPLGWTVDDSAMPFVNDTTRGVEEWEGWSFADKDWWTSTAGDQNRSQFNLASGIVAVADPDEWDDRGSPIDGSPFEGYYNALMRTPEVSLPTNGLPASLTFASSWRPEAFDDGPSNTNNQTAVVRASYDNGSNFTEILRWDSDTSSSTYKPSSTNEQVLLELNLPANANSVLLEFGLLNAGNDWWWAIDNVEIFTPTYLEVNQSSGEMTIHGAEDITGYEIIGPSGSLEPIDWQANNLDSQNIGPAVPLSADLNNDHVVDAADYTIWRDALNISDAGDINGDGITDQSDYNDWIASFGESLSIGESWETLVATDEQLLEFFLLGSTSFTQVTIGNAYNTSNGATNLLFNYTQATGEEMSGVVIYTGQVSAVAVPEPSTIVILSLSATLLCNCYPRA